MLNIVMVGSVKKPGTYQTVKVISGVVGQGGGIFQVDKLGQPVSVPYGMEYNPGSPITTTATATTQEKPLSTLTPVEQKKGFEGFDQRIRDRINILNTKVRRNIINPLEYTELLGYTALSEVTGTIIGYKNLPGTFIKIYKDPSLIKEIPKQLKQSAEDLGTLLRTSSGEATVKIGTNIFLLRGEAKALKELGKLSEKTLARLSTKFKGVAEAGDTLTIKTAKGKNVNLKVVDRTPTSSLKKQVQLSGKNVNAISSQVNKLLKRVISENKLIRKPIPDEATLSKSIKRQLEKFDQGELNSRQIIDLDRAIRKTGRKGLLERSFFADPSGNIRPSRLGIFTDKKYKGNFLEKLQKKYTDYVLEDITFIKNKPQILLFEDVKVQNFPKALKNIKNKLLKGKTLTKTEAGELLKFQLKKTGKFKPVGFITREKEITLAPGEIIRRQKKVGVALINGRKVDIIQARPFTPKGNLKIQLNRFKAGRLTKKEIKNLNRNLKRSTGFNYGLSSNKKLGKYVSLSKYGVSGLRSVGKYTPSSKSKLSRSTSLSKSRKYQGYKRTPTSKIIRSPGSYSPSSTTRKTPPSKSPPYKQPPLLPPIIKPPVVTTSLTIPKNRPLRVGKGNKEGYIIYEKRANKFYKLTSRPLRKTDALDKLSYRLDNKISKTGKIIKVIGVKKYGGITANERGYFNKFKNKFREYKIKDKKKYFKANTIIEKRKYGIDRPGEKSQLRLNRNIKGQFIKAKKR